MEEAKRGVRRGKGVKKESRGREVRDRSAETVGGGRVEGKCTGEVKEAQAEMRKTQN